MTARLLPSERANAPEPSRWPERALWAMVLLTALDDCEKPRHMGGHARARARAEARAEAVAFCQATAGAWADARTAVCDAAGIDPSAFRRAAACVESLP